MKKLFWIALILPFLASADLKRLAAFGFEPTSADENRVQIRGWQKISSAPASSYGAYTRNASGEAQDGKAQDGMSIYKWDTKSETSLSPKTIIITTAFTSPSEKDKNIREIYIYDYDKKLQLEAISYCLPGLKSCASVSAKSCAQDKPVDEELRTAHLRLLTSHYIGVGTSLPFEVAEKFKLPLPALSKNVCEYYFKRAMAGLKESSSSPVPSSKKSGSH